MYKLTLSIYADKSKPIEIVEQSKRLDTMVLQNNLKEVILAKLKKLNISSKLIFIEFLKEKNGEYFDHDEAWVSANDNFKNLDIIY